MAYDDPVSDDGESVLRRWGVLLLVCIFLADGLLRTSYMHLGARARGSDVAFLDTLIGEMSSAVAVMLLFFLVILPVTRRWPLNGPATMRNLGAHAVALVVYSACKSLLMWGGRVVLFPVAGLGRYDFGDLPYRFPMEFSSDVLGYSIMVAAVHGWDAWTELRRRQVREARLEASLSEARLQALQGRLQPHFLFNTLNVISSVMYADPERADRLLSALSDLLRTSLGAPAQPLHTLAEEMRVLDEYVEIMRARYGERLSVRMHVGAGLEDAAVPVFLLQPLVENAIQHGADRHAGLARIDVAAERGADTLCIHVSDDGPGIQGDPERAIGRGVGLANVRARLHHLFGDDASLRLINRTGAGLTVRVELPLTRSPAPAPEPVDPNAVTS